MARRSNDALMKDHADEIAGVLLDEVIALLRSRGLNSLALKRDIIEAVTKRLDEMAAERQDGA